MGFGYGVNLCINDQRFTDHLKQPIASILNKVYLIISRMATMPFSGIFSFYKAL